MVELKEESAYLYLLRYLWNNNFSVQNIFVIKSLYRAALKTPLDFRVELFQKTIIKIAAMLKPNNV